VTPLKIVNAALKAKTWTFKAKVIKVWPQSAWRPRLGLEDYITALFCSTCHAVQFFEQIN